MENTNLYEKAVIQYLIEQLGLEQYDQELADNPMKFIPAEEDEVTAPLKYFRIMNTIHTERLSEKDQKIIEEADDEKISEAAVRTFASTISEIPINTPADRETLTFYTDRMFVEPDFVTVDSVVVEIRTSGEYDEEGNLIDDNHELAKKAALKEIAERMEAELDGSLGDVPIRIFAGAVS